MASKNVKLRSGISISELMDENVCNTPKDKIIFEDVLHGKTATYQGFRDQYKRSAHWLHHEFGLKSEQIVSIISPSCVDYLIAEHAIWCTGATVSTINNALHPRELAYAIELVQPDFLIVHVLALESILKALELCKKNHELQILTIGGSHEAYPSFPVDKISSGDVPLKSFSLRGKTTHKVCAAILLSSGTTGNPKAVMLSHYNLVSTCLQLRGDNPDNWRGSQSEIFFPPLSHIYGVYVAGTMGCWLGAYVCVMARFNLEIYCQLMQDRQATLARLVPPVASQLARDPVVQKFSYPSLEYFSCSAAPLSDSVANDLQKAFPHVKLCQTYGCTELSGAIVQSGVRDQNLPLIAAGTPISNIEMRFLHEDGKDAGQKGPGEIAIRGPNLMMGYKGNDKAFKEALLDGGWYRSGDLGYLDANGYLIVYDRIKDVIKYKGFQIAPSELEKVISSHPNVFESAVCGVYSSEESTELPRAFVVPRKQPSSSAEAKTLADDIINFVSKEVSNYKRLRGGVSFVESLPKNPTGKILRRVLRDLAREDLGLQAKL